MATLKSKVLHLSLQQPRMLGLSWIIYRLHSFLYFFEGLNKQYYYPYPPFPCPDIPPSPPHSPIVFVQVSVSGWCVRGGVSALLCSAPHSSDGRREAKDPPPPAAFTFTAHGQ